jgi:hypothetical protein
MGVICSLVASSVANGRPVTLLQSDAIVMCRPP